MRILICGSRYLTHVDHYPIIHREIESLLKSFSDWPYNGGKTIIHGAAKGADEMAGSIARRFCCRVESHPADWKTHGKSAGPIRNQQMLESGVDLVLAFPIGSEQSGESKGTWDMVRRARAAGVEVRIVKLSTAAHVG